MMRLFYEGQKEAGTVGNAAAERSHAPPLPDIFVEPTKEA
jgi:hypothetical protein